MKVKIHYTINNYDEYNDSFIVEGETIEEVRQEAQRETSKRGLDEERNNLWSELCE